MRFLISLSFMLVCLLLMSCGDDCTTCTDAISGEEIEVCDDPEITYTDINGNTISFEEFLSFLESQGAD